MSNVVPIKAADESSSASLPALVDRAARALAGARTAAEVLEAREMAAWAYDTAKRAARLAKAKQAHDDLIGACYRAQADALDIEAQAKRRLADEYDAAQRDGDVAAHGGKRNGGCSNSKFPGGKVDADTTAAELNKLIHEGRNISEAEEKRPGVVRQALDAMLAGGEEPTRAGVRREVFHVREGNRVPGSGRIVDDMTPKEADDAFRETARYLWGAFLDPPPGIRARLKEAARRASEDDKRTVRAAASFLAELKEAMDV